MVLTKRNKTLRMFSSTCLLNESFSLKMAAPPALSFTPLQEQIGTETETEIDIKTDKQTQVFYSSFCHTQNSSKDGTGRLNVVRDEKRKTTRGMPHAEKATTCPVSLVAQTQPKSEREQCQNSFWFFPSKHFRISVRLSRASLTCSIYHVYLLHKWISLVHEPGSIRKIRDAMHCNLQRDNKSID